jgi:hypothetical protein
LTELFIQVAQVHLELMLRAQAAVALVLQVMAVMLRVQLQAMVV